jgi:predicted DNA binding CopG/RHH family protein
MKKKLVLPKFKNEDEERKFWDKIDLTDYYEPGDFVRVRFPNLKPTSTSISIRLPQYMVSELKVKANKLDIPYQTLIKQAIAKELKKW